MKTHPSLSQGLFLLLAFFGCLTAKAGNGPQNYLLVYDPFNSDNIAIANHLKETRGFPESNVIAVDFVSKSTNLSNEQAYAFIEELRSHIANRNLTDIHGVVLVGEAPIGVKTTLPDVPIEQQPSGGSLIAALWYAPNVNSPDDLTDAVNPATAGSPGFINRAAETVFQQTNTREIRSDINFSGDRYWLATHVGYNHVRGLRTVEALDLITRSKQADATFEEGTVYWPMNALRRGLEREPEIAEMISEWNQTGQGAFVFGSGENQIYGGVSGFQDIARDKTLPPGSPNIENRAVQGMIGGFDVLRGEGKELEFANNVYTKGALAEHLTSTAAAVGGGLFKTGSQMSFTEWLRWGAYGSSGSVSEPLAIAEKFPHPRLHSHYRNGATLAEAFMLSIVQPRHQLVSGDPLLQPYAYVPSVSISSPAQNATVSGNVTVRASANPANGGPALRSERHLFVNGTRKATFTGNSVTLDTTTLADGFHEIRVVAFTNNAVRTQGSATRFIRVNNQGANVRITNIPTAVNYRGNITVSADAGDLSDLDRIEIVANDIALATIPSRVGSATFPAQLLGHGNSTKVFAVAVRSDGTEVWSMPRTVNINWPNLAPLDVAPNSHLAKVNVWTDATSSNFDWTAPNRTGWTTGNGNGELQFRNQSGTIGFPLVSANEVAAQTAAVEFVTYFDADLSDFYEFAVASSTGLDLLVNGRLLYSKPSPGGNGGFTGSPAVVSERLAKGRHEIRLRVSFVKSESAFEFGVRSRNGRLLQDGPMRILDFIPVTRENASGGNPGTPPPPPPDDVPGNFRVTATTDTSVTLAWVDNSTGEIGFNINRSESPTFSSGITWLWSNKNTTTFTDTNLQPNKTYYYRIRVSYGGGTNSAWSNTVSADTGGSTPDPDPSDSILETFDWADGLDSSLGNNVGTAAGVGGLLWTYQRVGGDPNKTINSNDTALILQRKWSETSTGWIEAQLPSAITGFKLKFLPRFNGKSQIRVSVVGVRGFNSVIADGHTDTRTMEQTVSAPAGATLRIESIGNPDGTWKDVLIDDLELIASASGGGSGSGGGGGGAGTTLQPTADNNNNPTGVGTVDITSPVSQWTRFAMKFDLASITSVDTATLRVYRRDSDSAANTVEAYEGRTDAWNESSPSADVPIETGGVLDSVNSPGGGQWLEFDVTGIVAAEAAGDGTATLVLRTRDGNWSTFVHTRQNPANPPELLINGGE